MTIMIGTLRGTIQQKNPPALLIEVNGVGYELQSPMTTFYQLPEIQQSVLLYTHLVIREDAHQLFGFIKPRDRDLFRALIRVNGVGPKLALSILSGMEPTQFANAVQQNDVSVLIQIPGIGLKTAERLVIECRDSIKKWSSLLDANEFSHAAQRNTALQDAIDALTSLGYKPNEAKRALEKIENENSSVEDLIRSALQQMVKGIV